MTLADEEASAIAYANAILVLEQRGVRLGDLHLSAASQALVAAAGFVPSDLERLLSQVERFDLGARWMFV